MIHFPPFRFSAFLLVSAALLNGCCANNVCDCNDAEADAITLRFSTDVAVGGVFAITDLDTIIIQRYPKNFTLSTKPETVTLLRTAAQVRDSILLNNNAPFTQTGGSKLNRYRYVVQYLKQMPGSKPVATTALVIDSVRLRGNLDGSGCCTCYTNTEKTVFLNGDPIGKDVKANSIITINK
ncbi:hypothetical protein [Hymenobacter terrenus]|uniref:hypothetical protein n=1 Tax=Hymenobacter terrenus TaxID=1629124 RepID=UPI000619A8D8|nr:hypothetical protein [Hymenobacter terrenus]